MPCYSYVFFQYDTSSRNTVWQLVIAFSFLVCKVVLFHSLLLFSPTVSSSCKKYNFVYAIKYYFERNLVLFQKLKNRTADITRGTVQKSVCVLSSVPLYGHIQVKMALITHAYFEEGDFTKVSLLKDTYHHLNDCLLQIQDLHSAPQLFVGELFYLIT